MQQNVFDANHIAEIEKVRVKTNYIRFNLHEFKKKKLCDEFILELLEALPLHFNNFIVACSIVERIRFLHEIVHDIAWVEYGYPCCVVP